jgi:hypothetical protein
MFHQFASAEPKAKKKKKPKGPKRPLTAYLYFMKDMSPEMPATLSFRLKVKAVAAIWKGMSGEEKLKFEALAQKDRERYRREKAAASAGAGSSSSSSSSAAAPVPDYVWDDATKTLTINANVRAGQFRGRTDIEKVIIKEGVTRIESGAFRGCSSLASVAFPDALRTIGRCAFLGCSSLASVAFPAGLQTIGRYAFPDTCTVHRAASSSSSSSSSASSADEPQYTGGLRFQAVLDKKQAEAEAKGEVVDLTNDDAGASSAAAASSSTMAKRKVYYVQRFFKNGDPTDEYEKQELDPVELVQNKKLMPTSKKVRSKEDGSYWTPHIQKDFEDGQGFPSKYYVASGWSDADGYHVLASGDAFKGIIDPNKLLKQLLRNFSSGFGPYVEDDPWRGHQEFPIHNEMIIIERQVCRHLNKTARRILFDPSIIEGKNLIHPVVWIEGPPLEKEDEDQAAASSSSAAAAI